MEKDKKKELAKATEHIGAARTDFYLVRRSQAAVILSSAAVMLVGLFLPMGRTDPITAAVGFSMVAAGAVVVLATYVFIKLRGPMNYSVYYFRTAAGDETVLQFISKKRIFFAGKDKILELDRGNISLADSLYRAETPWDWFKTVEFTDFKLAGGGKDRRFSGIKDGKKAVLSLRGGHIEYGEADGLRMRYFDVNNLRGKVGLPAPFLSAIYNLGFSETDLPFLVALKK